MISCSLIVLICWASLVDTKIHQYEFVKVSLFPDISGHGVDVHIDTPSKHFDVYLEVQPDVVASNVVIDDGKEEYSMKDMVTSYSGRIFGRFNSAAIGSIANNRFEGILFFNGTSDNYHVEDGRLLSEVNCRDDPFYMPMEAQYCTVGYFGRDDDASSASEHERVKRSAVEQGLGMCGWNSPKIAASLNEMNPTPMDVNEIPKKRSRRAADTKPKVCSLFIQADYTLWNLYMRDYNDEQRTRVAITRLIVDIVSAVSTIYRLQDFYTDDKTIETMSGFSFKINKIRIFKKEEVCNSKDATLSKLCPEFIDSDALLKIISEMNHDKSCLAYIVSHRHFTGGVMGLAWLGYPSGYVGGVCQKQTRVSGGKKSSYNTGIITSNNQGSKASKRNLMLTLAHEIGHNFGSPHDTSPDCVHSGYEGHYLMYPYVNPGDKPNNDKLSDCSRNKIALNLDAVIRGRKTNCFTDTLTPFCGNQIIEGDEQCDCGLTKEECQSVGDTCCSPADASSGGCKLLSGKKCSPSQGPCCDSSTCDYVPPSPPVTCSAKTECAEAATCNGNSAACPPPPAFENLTYCASKTRRCYNGECSQSVCEEIGYEACQEPLPKNGDSARYCYLACKPRNANSVCINALDAASDSKMQELMDTLTNGSALAMPPGSPCDEYRGVCDVLQRCRKVNVQGPLAKMFSFIKGTGEIETAGDWLVHYWWVVAICSVVFIAIWFCLLKYCSDLLPTSNPKLEGKLTASQAMRRMAIPVRRRQGTHQRVPTNPPPF